ncbi:MAG: hypothetical protein Fur002_19080 [Anaerolineales bacterium]
MLKQRLNQLTFTRFFAVLVVIFFHGAGGIYYQAANFFPLAPLVRSATTAVTYLYALSGFVMALAHYRPQERFSFETYWKARFVRLYPLYILAFLLTCAYYADSIARIKLPKTLSNVFALQAWIPAYSQSFNFPAWSVTVEFFFYLIFPLFAWLAARRSARFLIWFSALFWALSQFVHNVLWIFYFPAQDRFLIYFPVFHLSSFLLGAAAGVWYLREGQTQKSNGWLLPLSVALTCLYVIYSPRMTGAPQGIQMMTGTLAPFLTVSILALAKDSTRLSAALSQRGFIALGEISYALYIFHIPFKWWYERLLAQASAAYWFDSTYLPLFVLFSFFAHYAVDLPLRKPLQALMSRVSLPLVLVDFILLPAALYLSFRWRFGADKEFSSYEDMMKLLFWLLLFIQTSLFALLGGFDLKSKTLLRSAALAAALAALAGAASVYAGYRLGWFVNFPRSVLLFNGLLFLAPALLARYFLQKRAA